MPKIDPLLALLYEALNEEFGLIVQTTSAQNLRTKLYPLRKTDPALECLTLIPSPANGTTELWIIKKKEPTDAETET